MSVGNCKFFLLNLLLAFLIISCGRQNEDVKNEHVAEDAKATAQDKAEVQRNDAQPTPSDPPQAIDPVDPENALPLDESISSMPMTDFPQNPFLGGFGGGGGGGSNRPRSPTPNVSPLPCENNTSDCNDSNPCTVDSCDASDTCVHIFDILKTEFGSCEVDGNSCTVGKCIMDGQEVVCHEESRAFLDAPLGCDDANDCTTDSCIVTKIADAEPGDQLDDEGNIILDNEHQCVSEIVNGLACFIEEECTFGLCTDSGTGNPGNEFTVACVGIGDQPQHFCPRPSGANACQVAVCTVGVGCEIVDATDGTACNDLIPCTENDICTGGVCGGTQIDCSDLVSCTIDFCDGAGACQHVPDNNLCDKSTNECQENLCNAEQGCVLTNIPAGYPCSNGDPCTIEDTCSGAGVCVPGATLNCPDNNQNDCQLAICTPNVGCAVANAGAGVACTTDANICTTQVCAVGGACVVAATMICPSDGNPCTNETCNPIIGCTYTLGNNGAPCDDNNACTSGEVCSAGVCLGGTDSDCDDGNVCTDDSCAAIGGCFATALNGPVGNACEVSTEGVFGICLNGYTQCDDGVEMTDMCVQIFRAGDKEEICENDLDDDCDGETDEAICACPAIPPGNNVFYVSTAGNDANDCSEANPCATIQHAHDVAMSGDAIVVAAGTFNESGITITNDLYIVGQGAGVTVIDGDGSGVFIVETDVSLVICGITVQDANTGLLINSGTAQVFNSAFIDSNAQFGAGILNNAGTLTVASTTISGNAATVTGGGILSTGSTSLINSTVENNSAGDVVTTAGQGGGISNIFATMTITDSVIRNNEAIGPTAVNVQGGGINNNGTLDMFTSTVDSNTAAEGAGIFNASNQNIDITDSTISNNFVSDAAGTGGGLRNGSNAVMTLTGTTVNNNSAADGAGIYQLGSLTVTNSTISTNTATSEGGGLYNSATTSLFTTTFSDNVATSGASIFLNVGTVTATHTIVANPSGASNCNVATVVDAGFNFDDDASCGIPTSAALNLGALLDNGGPTFTHALASPSDAIDAGDTSCGVTTDQRGEPRPVDFGTADPNPLCDIGAFELQN